tara:strand:- start:2834 stop:3907 length:1074 start_codon:yes stop_codon:yes gene_type:complete
MNLLFIIAFIIIIILFYKYLYLYSSEDEYHKHIHEDVDDLNESPIAKFKFHNKKSYNIAYYNLIYNDVFFKHDYDILKYNPIFKLDKNEILSGKSNMIKYKLNNKKNKINMWFNHYYLGGSSFLSLKSYSLCQEIINIPSNNNISFLLLPKLLVDYYYFINSKNYEILPRNLTIKRYSETLQLYFKDKNIKKRTFVLYTIIKKIYKSLDLNRPMRIMIPVPFKRFNKINNNIGAILLLFNGTETLEDFNLNFEKNKYMAYATNIMLVTKIDKLFSNNSNLRQKIDCVVTSIYTNKKNDYYPYLNYSLNWSTKLMPMESIYTAVYSRINNDSICTDVTYTVSTSKFKKTPNMKKYNIY